MKRSNRLKKKVLFFISNGIGEIEFSIPYLFCIDTTSLDINFLYLNKSIYENANKDLLFSKLINNKKYKKTFLINENVYQINFLIKYFYYIISSLFLFFEIVNAQYLVIDYGRVRGRFCKLAKFFALLLNKKIYAMPHTWHADYLFKMNEVPKKNMEWLRKKETLLSIDKYSYSYNRYILNFKSQFNVGDTRKNRKFLNFVTEINPIYDETFILYCSNKIVKHMFTIKNKEDHIKNFYEVIRKYYSDKKIIISLHPRENKNDVLKIIKKFKFENVEISTQNSFLLCKDAILTVGTLTNAIRSPYYFGKNSILYWENCETYLPTIGVSAPHEYLNIKHAKTKRHLDDLVKSHLDGNDLIPQKFKFKDEEIRNAFETK